MTYDMLAKVIADAGFFTTGDFSREVICASKIRPEGGYSGNSFWIAKRANGWFLGTWGVHIYRVPDPERIADLCIGWLRRHPDGTAADVDDWTREEFHLCEIDPDDFPDE
jgi:hypothetical protein